MKRLTYDFVIGDRHCWQVKGADNLLCNEVCKAQGDNGCVGCPIAKAFNRLAAYENTNLEPEEIKEFIEDVESGFVLWINKRATKFMDIMQAEKEGRLAILPKEKP